MQRIYWNFGITYAKILNKNGSFSQGGREKIRSRCNLRLNDLFADFNSGYLFRVLIFIEWPFCKVKNPGPLGTLPTSSGLFSANKTTECKYFGERAHMITNVYKLRWCFKKIDILCAVIKRPMWMNIVRKMVHE